MQVGVGAGWCGSRLGPEQVGDGAGLSGCMQVGVTVGAGLIGCRL